MFQISDVIDFDELRILVEESYQKAKDSLYKYQLVLEKSGSAISDRIPIYSASKLDFGAFIHDEFTTLFADMRSSTSRANAIGPEKTFLTLHAIMPTLVFIVENIGGTVVDLPGDGVMALFKGNPKGLYYRGLETLLSRTYLSEVDLAYLCGRYIFKGINEVVNPILIKDRISPIAFGIGVDSGAVIVTKTGTRKTFDTKVIGNSVNNAAKLSDGYNELRIHENAIIHLNGIAQKEIIQSYNKPYYYYKTEV